MLCVNLINRIHRNSSGRLVSGYLLNGVLTEDENVQINRSVPRLKGGIFILNMFEGVALFKNFSLQECNNFGQNGTCLEGISSMIY